MFLFPMLVVLVLLGALLVFFPLVPLIAVAALGVFIYHVAANHHRTQHHHHI